jgi:hypothetical protein
MKTKLFTGLALAAALLMAGPAYAKDSHHRGGGGRGHAVAAAHHGGGARHIAASSHRSAPKMRVAARGHRSHAQVASRRAFAARNTRAAAAKRSLTHNNVARANVTRNNVASANVTSNNMARANMNRRSVAFGGNGYANNGGGHYRYAFASHAGWNHGQEYSWHGHHYRWMNNGWFIIDPFPWVAGYYGPGYNSPGYYNGGSVSVSVQQALSQQGYYNGPIDGIVGPGTSAAIATYQQNNGLRVTGTITPSLLNSLGVG